VGTVLLDSYGDLRSHRHHGLFGVLVVEPENSIYLNPVTGALLKSGREAVIVNSGTGKKYREFVPVFMDGLNLRKGFSLLLDSDEPFEMNAGGHEGHPMENPEIPVFAIPRNAPVSPEWVRGQDLESQGESAINYKTERLVNRADFQRDMTGFILENQFNPLSFSVFASSIHGDPETPVFESFAGDPVVFRISRPCDLSNVQTIGIDNHSWKLEPKDADSNIINVQGGIGVGKTIDAKLIDGAGGFLKAAGDYLYNDRNHIEQNCHLAGGLWGLFRVHSFGAQARIRPLDTLEYITVTTALFASASKIWTIRGTNSVTGTGITITVKLNRTGEIIATTSVDINGNWSLIIRNSPVSVLPGDTINVKSSRGAIVDYYKVTVR